MLRCIQAQAVAHKQAHMEAQSHAQHFAAKAQRHAQARMEAAAQAQHLKRVVQMGVFTICFLSLWVLIALQSKLCIRCLICACAAEEQLPSKVVAQAQEYEAQAQGHAQAQSQLVVHAHNLTAKAHAHANAQVSPKLVCFPYCSMFHIGLYWSRCHIKLPGSDLSIISLLCRHKLRHRPIRLLRRRATSMRPHRGCRLRQT